MSRGIADGAPLVKCQLLASAFYEALRHELRKAAAEALDIRSTCTSRARSIGEDINLDELIATALDDPQAIGESKAFRGINFTDLLTAYRQFCKDEKLATPAVDLAEVIDFYNKALIDLPDHTRLNGLKLPGGSVVLDHKGRTKYQLLIPSA